MNALAEHAELPGQQKAAAVPMAFRRTLHSVLPCNQRATWIRSHCRRGPAGSSSCHLSGGTLSLLQVRSKDFEKDWPTLLLVSNKVLPCFNTHLHSSRVKALRCKCCQNLGLTPALSQTDIALARLNMFTGKLHEVLLLLLRLGALQRLAQGVQCWGASRNLR